MAFLDIRLPEIIESGAIGGPTHNTAIVETTGGHEKRQRNWSAARYKWNVGSGLRDAADLDVLLAHWQVCAGRAHSFRFKDWSDFIATDQTLGTGDGSTKTFQLIKRYQRGAYAEVREITKPVSGTVRLYRDGIEALSGWSVNLLTGLVTFTAAPTSGVVVKGSCEFDIPVRFQEDEFQLTLDEVDQGSAVLNVVEVRGE